MTEILDANTQNILRTNLVVATSSDFCMSNKFVAQILAMVAESRAVKGLLDELLGAGGASLHVRATAWLVAAPGERVAFAALQARAAEYDEVLVGYQERGCSMGETTLNPSDKTTPRVWDDFDFVILATEPERGADDGGAPGAANPPSATAAAALDAVDV